MYLTDVDALTVDDRPCARRRKYRSRQRVAGVGLIEVLIAVLVMAIGMLGIAAMQATALRNSQSSLERSQAVVHSYAALDAMRANLPAARAGAYNMDALVCDVPAAGATLATSDQRRWVEAIHANLGDTACGQISCLQIPGSDQRDCSIVVQWNDARGTDGSDAQQITTRSRI